MTPYQLAGTAAAAAGLWWITRPEAASLCGVDLEELGGDRGTFRGLAARHRTALPQLSITAGCARTYIDRWLRAATGPARSGLAAQARSSSIIGALLIQVDAFAAELRRQRALLPAPDGAAVAATSLEAAHATVAALARALDAATGRHDSELEDEAAAAGAVPWYLQPGVWVRDAASALTDVASDAVRGLATPAGVTLALGVGVLYLVRKAV